MSQKELVLDYLKTAGPSGITPLKAQGMFRIWRLSDVVFRLKKAGHNIVTKLERDPTGKSFARYVLVKD